MNSPKLRNPRQAGHSKLYYSAIIFITLFLTLSCSLTGGTDPSIQQTMSALSVQQTVLAQQSGQNQQATSQAAQSTQVAMNVQATVIAQQANQPVAPPPQPAQTEAVVAPPPAQPAGSPEPAVDINELIKSAKILLYEDMAGTGQLELVQEALDMGGYTYKDDGSAMGWFKEDLLSGTKWDLIIAASERRTSIQGEFFVYLMDQINKGTAVIIEHWAIDNIAQGKIAPVMAKCGVALHRDWFVPFGELPNLSVWFVKSEHPVFQEPNHGMSLRSYANFWANDQDKGDLLKLTGSGDAELLAGTIATSKSDHGTLISCMGGRMIIQTHSSHEYGRADITNLYQNYIYYTLKNHFLLQTNTQ